MKFEQKKNRKNKEKLKRQSLYLPEKLILNLKEYSVNNKLSMNSIIIESLKEYLKKKGIETDD